jgi:hypothetical protein
MQQGCALSRAVHDLQKVCLQGLPEGKQNSQQNIQADYLQGLLDED